jgi:hypothetical protein
MSRRNKIRIGWVITDQLDAMPIWPRIDTGVGGVSLARLHWIAPRINQEPKSGFHCEVYNPWRSYDGLVFLKAMGEKAEQLAKRYREKGKPVLFDANVNYYRIEGSEHYQGMLPSIAQQRAAVAMTEVASAVIADSEYIAAECSPYNRHVSWIPDNVEMEQVPPLAVRARHHRLRVVWCGEAVKLFELLVIEEVLRFFSKHIHLIVITNDLSVMSRWHGNYKQKMGCLLDDLCVDILPYRGVQHLFETYNLADFVISPRFLDNTYNLGHTEWKITLAMACGCIALGSPVPSYEKIQNRALNKEIVICHSLEEWQMAFELFLSNEIDVQIRESSRKLVDKYYSSRVVAGQYVKVMQQLFADAEACVVL